MKRQSILPLIVLFVVSLAISLDDYKKKVEEVDKIVKKLKELVDQGKYWDAFDAAYDLTNKGLFSLAMMEDYLPKGKYDAEIASLKNIDKVCEEILNKLKELGIETIEKNNGNCDSCKDTAYIRSTFNKIREELGKRVKELEKKMETKS